MKRWWIILIASSLLACDSARTEYNTSIDFKVYKTFCWLEGCTFTFTGPAYLNDSIIQDRVRESIISSLQKIGLTYDDQNPDLLVDFHITVESERVVYYHGVQDDPSYFRTPFLQPAELNVNKGTILIHIIDRQRSEVIWQSYAEGYLSDPPDLSEKNIRRGISRLLKDFPQR
ncbi:MAG: DUF4136 domain-containing protein [Cyclobacteriaceae bacterium]|nr:DUF4136 domain-containing protein [Cyclobacteriaceae bacterium]